MVDLLEDKPLISQWKTFFEEKCKSDIETLALSFPETRSLFVDFEVIDRYSQELANGLVEHPYKYQFNAEATLREIDTAADFKMALHFRVINLQEYGKIPIRRLMPNQLGKLVALEGMITKKTPIQNKLQMGTFQCQKCGVVIKTEQTSEIVMEPTGCCDDQGGCGRVTSFKLLSNLSTYVAGQKLQIQENPESIRGGSKPNKITVFLEDDITSNETINPGDRICLNGVLFPIEKKRGKETLVTSDFGLNAWSYEVKESAYEDLSISDEDKKEIIKASKDPSIYEQIRQSIAPSIFGLDDEKDAMALQAFGGEAKILPDGTRVRGDIHVLLVGDPATAKSQLLEYMSRLVLGSVFTAGPSSTGAGLTAAAVQDKFTEGWELEAGTLVLADMSLACVDEFDKMNGRDRGAMHQALAQQEISVAKAGINTTLKARCSLLAAANPKLGRLDEFIPLHEQINLSSALISRFDLIFSIIDKPKKDYDEKLAEHILRSQQTPNYDKITPFYSTDFLQKYIAYAKQNSKPTLSDDALYFLKEYYVRLRASSSDGSVPVTPRQLEGLIRLSTASARIRLDDEITVNDADRAVKIFQEYIKRVGMDYETGKIDSDIIEIGCSHSQQDRMRTILDIVKRLGSESSDGFAVCDNILHETEIEGIDADRVESCLKRLEQENMVERRGEEYKVLK